MPCGIKWLVVLKRVFGESRGRGKSSYELGGGMMNFKQLLELKVMRTLEQSGAHAWPWWGPCIRRHIEDVLGYLLGVYVADWGLSSVVYCFCLIF